MDGYSGVLGDLEVPINVPSRAGALAGADAAQLSSRYSIKKSKVVSRILQTPTIDAYIYFGNR